MTHRHETSSFCSARLGRMLAVASFNILSNTAFAPVAMGAVSAEAPKLTYLKPVEVRLASQSSTKASGSVQVTYDEGCGESLRGVLVDETKKGLYFAAVLERSDTMCLTLPKKRTITLKTSGGKPARALSLRDTERVTLAEIADVTVSQKGLSIAWQDTCRPYVGVVMSPAMGSDGSPKMSLLVANLPKDGLATTGTKTCPRETLRKQISGITVAADHLQVDAKPGPIEKLFTPRIVAPEAVSVSADGVLSVTWKRSCRDVPLAALFAGKDGSQIAMVSAFVPNAPCSFKGQKTEVYSVDHFLIAPSQSVKAMPDHEALALASRAESTLSLQPITAMKMTRLGQGDWLMAATEAGCGDRIGILLGRDSNGNAAMAHLASGNQKVCHVSTKNSSETLTAPLVAPSQGPIPKVFSLKVFGTAIN